MTREGFLATAQALLVLSVDDDAGQYPCVKAFVEKYGTAVGCVEFYWVVPYMFELTFENEGGPRTTTIVSRFALR